MNFRFWKLGINFMWNPENFPSVSATYFDGGIEFQFVKAVMRFDWGYYYSDWAIHRLDDLWELPSTKTGDE